MTQSATSRLCVLVSRSLSGRSGMGRAGTITARASRRTNSSTTRPTGPCGPGTTWRRTVRQVLRALGEIGRGLAQHQPDGHPVGVGGGGHLAEHRQDDPALMPGRQPGDGHHPGPPAPVAPPAPPPAPRRASDPAGERGRPEEPPGGQHHHDPGEQEDQAQPADVQPGQHQHGQRRWRPPGAGRSAGPARPAAGPAAPRR